MKRFHLLFYIILSLVFVSCGNKDEEELRQKIQEEYSTTTIKKLSSGSKAQYIQMEQALNKRYVRELDSLANTFFDRQLENFEEHELGIWNSFMNMFSWLFKSKDSWDEELNLISKKYFNTLDSQQEQNKLYNQYVTQIRGLRQQFMRSHNLPAYQQFDIPQEAISLDKMAEHSRNNLVIEILGEFLGSDLFKWLLTIAIASFLSLFGISVPGPGWVLTGVTILISIIVSIILTMCNDSRLIDNLKEQHQETVQIDNQIILDELNQNTVKFYEKL